MQTGIPGILKLEPRPHDAAAGTGTAANVIATAATTTTTTRTTAVFNTKTAHIHYLLWKEVSKTMTRIDLFGPNSIVSIH